MSRRTLVVVGDVLLDRDVEGTVARVSPDAPVPVLDQTASVARPGGAALAAALAAAGGHRVVLVTGLGDDPAGQALRGLLEAAGVEVVAAPTAAPTPEKIRFRCGGHPLLRVDRGWPADAGGPLPAGALEAVEAAGVVLVSDYGRGTAGRADVRAALRRRRLPTVWDPHPRGPAPVAGITVVTPNRAELELVAPPAAPVAPGSGELAAAVRQARAARQQWGVQAVAATLGAEGAILVDGDGPPLAVPATPERGDPCGAGDSFAAALACALLSGAVLPDAVTAAVAAAGRFVAAGGAAGVAFQQPAGFDPAGHPQPAAPAAPAAPAEAASGPRPLPETAPASPRRPAAVAGAVRAAGGRVVVAGGCFDLLHAGHVALLQAARRLGDCLIVALNSDESVRRLKGAGRPVVTAADRAAMLQALSCVDAVAVFDEDSPAEVLRALRPDVFAKGGDYSNRRLPEVDILDAWGGQVVILPYLTGRSTTGLLQVAAGR